MSEPVLADSLGADRLVLLDLHTRLPIALYDFDEAFIVWAMRSEDPPVEDFPHRINIHRGTDFYVLDGWASEALAATIRHRQTHGIRVDSMSQLTRLFGDSSRATISEESADRDDEPLRGASHDYLIIDERQDDDATERTATLTGIDVSGVLLGSFIEVGGESYRVLYVNQDEQTIEIEPLP